MKSTIMLINGFLLKSSSGAKLIPQNDISDTFLNDRDSEATDNRGRINAAAMQLRDCFINKHLENLLMKIGGRVTRCRFQDNVCIFEVSDLAGIGSLDCFDSNGRLGNPFEATNMEYFDDNYQVFDMKQAGFIDDRRQWLKQVIQAAFDQVSEVMADRGNSIHFQFNVCDIVLKGLDIEVKYSLILSQAPL